MTMNAAHPWGEKTRLTPTTAAAQVFEVALAHQRIAPEDAVATATFLTRGVHFTIEGFVTVEAARTVAAKALFAAKESACGVDAETLIQVANEIAPEFPYIDGHGDLVWACCVSTIGTLCNHRLTPPSGKRWAPSTTTMAAGYAATATARRLLSR